MSLLSFSVEYHINDFSIGENKAFPATITTENRLNEKVELGTGFCSKFNCLFQSSTDKRLFILPCVFHQITCLIYFNSS